jgi:hypothetical protein
LSQLWNWFQDVLGKILKWADKHKLIHARKLYFELTFIVNMLPSGGFQIYDGLQGHSSELVRCVTSGESFGEGWSLYHVFSMII